MRRTLVATTATVLLVLGLALPGSAQPDTSAPGRAAAKAVRLDARADEVKPASVCSITIGGKPGRYICEYGYTSIVYGGRHHVFLVGDNRKVYHIFQVRAGGPFSNWVSLDGTAVGTVDLLIFDAGRALRAKVLGTDLDTWCRAYNTPENRGRWEADWHRCPV